MKNKIPWLLCVAGGVMLIISGAVGNVGIFDTIAEIAATIPELTPYLPTIELVRQALAILSSFGGNIVLIGGFLLTIEQLHLGKFLVGAGAGMGIFGLIITIGQTLYTTGLDATLTWITGMAMTMNGGAILLTILARMMAGKSKK
ncbi:MAG: hypothetical protein ACXADC_10145 [Candidatus Thorarchaeota archaeon]|jgi:hypothetical protein